jgi:hypothetical protein
MALMMQCGVCGKIEKAHKEQVFRGMLINKDGEEIHVEIRLNSEQAQTRYNETHEDHLCASCIRKVIKKGESL